MPISKQLLPRTPHNVVLQSNVHPSDWKNPTATRPYHLVVIGAGTAGLVTAAGAAGLGARVALIERELMGGDCLNVGCVPSKALLHVARTAAAIRHAADSAINVGGAEVNFAEAMERMRELRAEISPNDSAQRFTDLGVDVYFGQAAFEDSATLSVTQPNGECQALNFRKAVICSGARASAPAISGLSDVDYLTNESIFSLTELPERFGIIGGGPIGCEMAQAFANFGSDVSLFERSSQVLSREDPEAGKLLACRLQRDGVQLFTDASNLRVQQAEGHGIVVDFDEAGSRRSVEVDQLLVAVGRAPNVDGLGLDAVGVEFTEAGVQVNEHLQTTNRRIYAAGDVCSSKKFTHAADFQARIVIQNSLFAVGPFGRKKNSSLVIPWATYTSPEVAHVGLTEASANSSGIEMDTYIQHFADVDRAILEGQTDGFVKVHTQRGTDRIVGATIVAEHAGDMISEIVLAMTHGLGLAKIGSTIHPYPTQAEAIRKLGDQFNRTKLTPLSQRILGLLRRFNVGR